MPLTTPFNLVSSELARQSHWMTAGPFQLKYSVLFNYSLRCAQFTPLARATEEASDAQRAVFQHFPQAHTGVSNPSVTTGFI